MDKIHLKFYRERKCPSLVGFTMDTEISINTLINHKVSYDPFLMKVKGTKRHNAYSLLRLIYSNYLRGFINKDELIYKIKNNIYLAKYENKLK